MFATTHWSVVFRAGDSQGDEHVKALDALCRGYWYPLYAYVRRLGHSPHDAQDFTQAFFAYLLSKRLLTKATPESGRFRSFLLGSLKNFMANEWRRQSAQKRDDRRTISFDAQDAEQRYAIEPMDEANPQLLYEQAWAVAVLEQSLSLLEAEYAASGKQPLFDHLAPCLQGDRQARPYAEIGARLAMSEGAVKVAAHRLRQRYRELLRASVANTVADPLEIDGELRHLMNVLGR
ncbi:MAG: sigma-70 family RNA polymerase sigma factor [Verrucomicrobia bacterium]|nr:sigma-70 family RNA polymerase sigma factor [Verrucomicrobiota bacterium]MBI3870299.1 sigma-70 family RNA polymerase sigma factor [Verrucomicrobiota bacterium]